MHKIIRKLIIGVCILTPYAYSLVPGAAHAYTLTREHKTDIVAEALIDMLDAEEVGVALDPHILNTTLSESGLLQTSIESVNVDAKRRRFVALIAIKDKETLQKMVEATGRYTKKILVPVPADRIISGTLITEEDLIWRSMPEAALSATTASTLEDVVGMEARRTLSPNRLLRRSDLTSPKLVRKGQNVTMHVKTDFMQLTAQGRALADGSLGQSIRILNPVSKKVVQGVVVADQTVEVAQYATPEATTKRRARGIRHAANY